MTPPLRPTPLSPGATIGVVASSSPVFGEDDLRRGVRRLADAGFAVRFLPGARSRDRYLAGPPDARAEDLRTAFADDGVDAVLQLRGGYGAADVLELLDLDVVRAHPKPFIGMSDTTLLHLALGQGTGLHTFWGPGLTGLGRASAYTWSSFLDALCRPQAPRRILEAPDGVPARTVVGGTAEGPLLVGTTTLLAASLGTPWEVETAGRILVVEDVGEEPYRVDRLLTHLRLAGKLDAAAGIVVAEHAGIRPRGSFPGGSFSLDEIVERVVAPLGRPTMAGLPLGHGRHLATVPLGVPARLDADAATLTLLDTGLTASTPGGEGKMGA